MINNLNNSQKQAVVHVDGPMMVLAGPGSGKTTVIMERIAYLIGDAGVDPSNILVITFTKAAANEMKERFLKRAPREGVRVTFGTFHAVFFMILKHAYHYNASNIIREEEKAQFMRELVHSMRLQYDDEGEFVQGLLSEISFLKNSRIRPEHYYPMNVSQEVFSAVVKEYGQFLRRYKKIDFDDMLVYTYELFAERKDILAAWQGKYRYILIDEFQDINRLQYDIVRMLAAPANNLFAVGDDDQSIYRFRGAKPEIMLHFPQDYPDAKIVSLSFNYRCPQDVVQMAEKIIGYNKNRFPKEIQAVKPGVCSVTVERFASQREENKRLVERILGGEAALGETAVLFRTNTQARLLMEQMMEYNIPFVAKDRILDIYGHFIAKDLYAYIRIAQGSRRRHDFLKIMNRPKRYLSRDSLPGETVSFDAWQAFYADQPWVEERIVRLLDDIRAVGGMRPFAAVNYIRKAIGYDAFLKEYAEYRNIEEEGLMEVLDTLHEASRDFETFEEWFLHIEACRKKLEEMNRRQEGKQGQQDAVTLATFHSAKGLEFDVVHMIDVNEGVTPYKKAVLLPDMEEERRMFYVGVTRAKEKLHLYVPQRVNHHEAELSRFLIEAGYV